MSWTTDPIKEIPGTFRASPFRLMINQKAFCIEIYFLTKLILGHLCKIVDSSYFGFKHISKKENTEIIKE